MLLAVNMCINYSFFYIYPIQSLRGRALIHSTSWNGYLRLRPYICWRRRDCDEVDARQQRSPATTCGASRVGETSVSSRRKRRLAKITRHDTTCRGLVTGKFWSNYNINNFNPGHIYFCGKMTDDNQRSLDCHKLFAVRAITLGHFVFLFSLS